MSEVIPLAVRAARAVEHDLGPIIGGSVSFGSEHEAPSGIFEPLPDPLPAVPELSPELLPESIREWCVDAADALQVPLDFTAIPAMVALAGALGRTVGIAMKRNAPWIELPILWGCVVGRPSSGKSPALTPARRMLDRLAGEEREAFEQAQREYAAKALLSDANRAHVKKEIQKAIGKGDKDGAEGMALGLQDDGSPPTEPRIVINDSTVEKFGELLNANPRGLVQFRDELAGWLSSLDREGREGDRAFWLECWNGSGSYTVDRIGRGTIRIEACAASILGGMQPGKLADYVRGAVRGGMADDGLLQRFQLCVHPDLPANWRYSDRNLDRRAEDRAWMTFKRLRNINVDELAVERAPWAELPFLRFDDEAQDLFVEWFTEHMKGLRAGDEPAWLESHYAKYPALVGRLSLLLHLADGGRGPVPADVLARALNWIEHLSAHARRIYAPIVDGGIAGARLLLKRRKEIGDTFTVRDIYRRGWSGLADQESVDAALVELAERHYVAAKIKPSYESGGRPTTVFTWRLP